MKDLMKQYNKTFYQINKAKESASEEDFKILSGMVGDLQYALEWMRTAKRPGNRRGIERRVAYQRAIPADPQLLQVLVSAYRTGRARYRRVESASD